MSKIRKLCIFDCGNEMDHPKSGLCSSCYNAVNYWRKKTVTQMVKYVQKLTQRRGRMERMLNDRGTATIYKKAR